MSVVTVAAVAVAAKIADVRIALHALLLMFDSHFDTLILISELFSPSLSLPLPLNVRYLGLDLLLLINFNIS